MPIDFGKVWNGWSRNYLPKEDGFIIHAFDETDQRTKANANPNHRLRSLCGVRIAESGLQNLKDKEFEPGCTRCKRILIKHGWTFD